MIGIMILVILAPVTRAQDHQAGNNATFWQSSKSQIEPKPTILKEIELVMDMSKDISDDDFEAKVSMLEAWHTLGRNVGPRELLPQLVYYSIHRSDNVLESMAFEYGLRMLELADAGISDTAVATALMPYLSADDPKLKRKITRHLHHLEDWRNGRPDYLHYRAIIIRAARNGDRLPRPLIRYMYESHPGEAVLTMMRAFPAQHHLAVDERKPILWTEHQVAEVFWKWKHGFLPKDKVESEAAKALRRLVHHKQWWVRLYVVEILRQHSTFRTDELIAILQKDPHEGLRSIVQTFASQQNSPANE